MELLKQSLSHRGYGFPKQIKAQEHGSVKVMYWRLSTHGVRRKVYESTKRPRSEASLINPPVTPVSLKSPSQSVNRLISTFARAKPDAGPRMRAGREEDGRKCRVASVEGCSSRAAQ